MNVTPLIDVLLVLIIIFMIVVTQEQKSGLKAQIPQPADDTHSAPPPERTIVIRVLGGVENQEPTLKINAEDVHWVDLKGRLHDIFKARAERVAFVQGEDEVEFQWVADVIDTAREAGVDRVGLLPKEMARVR
jgi:biopolymer transport protein ExbD